MTFNRTDLGEIGHLPLQKLPTDFSFYALTTFLTFTVLYQLISQFYGKGFYSVKSKMGKAVPRKDKNDKGYSDWGKLPGLEAIPGPKSWDPTGLIGNLFDFLPLEKALDTCSKWSVEYGDAFKYKAFGSTFVGLNSGPAVQSLLRSTDMGHLVKTPEIYDPMKPFITNGVLVSKGALWQHERKILLKSQTFQNVKAYMPRLSRHCQNFVKSLDALFQDGKPHQINELINSSFIKVISEMITGFDSDTSDECGQYHHNFQIWKESLVFRIINPWLLFPPFWKLHPRSRKHDKAVGELFDFARRRIRDHKQKRDALKSEQVTNSEEIKTANKVPFRSVLDELIDGGVEEGQIVEEINTMMFGGHETGAATIHFFFFCMALNPEIQKECQLEIDELWEDPQSHTNGALKFDMVSSGLKLVERCILETLRLTPPVFAFTRKLSSPLKINCNGQDIVLPPGCNAGVNTFILHRKPEYFPEPLRFNPDRFLPEECAKRHPYAFVPFSGGPRNCIGMKFAMIEMKTVAAYTLRHFSIKTTDRMEDIPLLPYITTTPAKDYTFQFIKRDI